MSSVLFPLSYPSNMAFPPPLQSPYAEYTLSNRSREARAPPEPKGFRPNTGPFDPEIKILSVSRKAKKPSGAHHPGRLRLKARFEKLS
jgi:hypothetical protein